MDEFITLNNEKYFEKIKSKDGNRIIYKSKNYSGPIAIDAKIQSVNPEENPKEKENDHRLH